ncbi:MAG: metal ABC transporter ATP-binding protein [Phascolarctobacterium sp.]|nr:metal ABC transporter ATP-binding protein [Phascolarctobacterium sp.]
MKKIIEIKDLGFDYGEGWVFHKLNLEIAEGDFVAVIGANGAGKSTLLKMLANVIEPTSGDISYYGMPIKDFKNWERIGYVPQNPGRQQKNFPISVREVVGLGLLKGNSLIHRFNGQDKEAINQIMERFNLMDLRYRKIGELSGGQQQRVFLARAMVKQPKILLLDEPATGIDTAAKADLYAMLKNINRQQGVTIVMVSHDLELAADAAQNALCLDHGICFWGEVHAALKHHHRHGYFYR